MSENYVQCPYNPSHTMPASRLKSHLAKACKDQLQKRQHYSICPYNPLHHVQTIALQEHMMSCGDREAFLRQEKLINDMKNMPQEPNPWESQPSYFAPPGFAENPNTVDIMPPPGFSQMAQEENKQTEQTTTATAMPEEEGIWSQVRTKKSKMKDKQSNISRADPESLSLAEMQLKQKGGAKRKKQDLKKKLKDIELLEDRQRSGFPLDPQQLEKITKKASVQEELTRLG